MSTGNNDPNLHLPHLDEQGKAKMVDVGDKDVTSREAIARGHVSIQPETLRLIKEGLMKKGDVLTIAQLAGIMGAKKTSDLIPLCHPLPLDKVDVELELDDPECRINITATARTTARTGVEMEALTAVTVAGLTSIASPPKVGSLTTLVCKLSTVGSAEVSGVCDLTTTTILTLNVQSNFK